MRLRSLCSLTLLLAGSMALAAAKEEPTVDPQADQALREMSDFLQRQRSFTVRTRSTLQRLDGSGEDQQFGGIGVLAVERPNKLRFERGGEAGALSFIFDGTKLFVSSEGKKSYTSTAAPKTLESAMATSRKELGVTPPGADLFVGNPYETLMQGTTAGRVVATMKLGDATVRQLAFSGPEKDWQIWIETGDQPLPRKLVVGLKEPRASPVNTLELNGWVLDPKLAPEQFSIPSQAQARRTSAR